MPGNGGKRVLRQRVDAYSEHVTVLNLEGSGHGLATEPVYPSMVAWCYLAWSYPWVLLGSS